jgi:hypothetical protein
MNKTIRSSIALILSLLFVVCLVSCNNPDAAKDVWEDATYKEDATFGNGAKTVVVEVKVNEHLVTFTIKTDKDTVGAALLEHGLIAGEEGAFGLYVKVVNGITADYDVNQCYWSFLIDGKAAMTGVDGEEIKEGVVYRLEYAK